MVVLVISLQRRQSLQIITEKSITIIIIIINTPKQSTDEKVTFQ